MFLRPARASPWLGVERKTRDRRETWMNAKTKRLFCRLKKRTQRHCGRQEEPVILISRLLLRMPGKYVASFKKWMECTKMNLITRVWTFFHSLSDHARFDHLSLFIWSRVFWPSITRYLTTRVLTIYHSLSEHACFGHLSRETYAKQTTVLEQQSVWPSIVSPALPNLWLFLVLVANLARSYYGNQRMGFPLTHWAVS